MKYVLSLLILFSGLGFTYLYYTSIYLVCDEPHYFTPDFEKRRMIDLFIPRREGGTHSAIVTWWNDKELELENFDLVATKSDDYYSFGFYTLDRETLELKFPLNGLIITKCKEVNSNRWNLEMQRFLNYGESIKKHNETKNKI